MYNQRKYSRTTNTSNYQPSSYTALRMLPEQSFVCRQTCWKNGMCSCGRSRTI
ncbi:MAG: hypothetical protein Q7R96_04465 [Nanoarchaeota archaeon]|nr:hypothetical protein [Nanoarchaeota archaeon]